MQGVTNLCSSTGFLLRSLGRSQRTTTLILCIFSESARDTPGLENVHYTGGPSQTPSVEIYAEYVELLVFHLMARPELRLTWALEAVSRRLIKRLLISVDVTRKAIIDHVELQRFINSEERNAFSVLRRERYCRLWKILASPRLAGSSPNIMTDRAATST